jgi:hypothetical protein
MPACGHFLRYDRWTLMQRRVQPYSTTPVTTRRPRLLEMERPHRATAGAGSAGRLDGLWRHITAVNSTLIPLNSDGMQQHSRNLAGLGSTAAYHQTSFVASEQIIASQRFRPGSDGCGSGRVLRPDCPGSAREDTPSRPYFGCGSATGQEIPRGAE